MARQRLADETDPLRFRAVIEEYVLDRIVGRPLVVPAQLEHLLALLTRDNVEPHLHAGHRRRSRRARLCLHAVDFDEAGGIG